MNLPLFQVILVAADRDAADGEPDHRLPHLLTFATSPADAQQITETYRTRFMVIEPVGSRFRIGYGATPTSTWGRREVGGKIEEIGCWELCTELEVIALVDRIVPRDLQAILTMEAAG